MQKYSTGERGWKRRVIFQQSDAVTFRRQRWENALHFTSNPFFAWPCSGLTCRGLIEQQSLLPELFRYLCLQLFCWIPAAQSQALLKVTVEWGSARQIVKHVQCLRMNHINGDLISCFACSVLSTLWATGQWKCIRLHLLLQQVSTEYIWTFCIKDSEISALFYFMANLFHRNNFYYKESDLGSSEEMLAALVLLIPDIYYSLSSRK